MKKGFGLIEILITVGIIALLYWGGNSLYFNYFKQEKAIIQQSTDAKDQAQAVKDLNDIRNKGLQNELIK